MNVRERQNNSVYTTVNFIYKTLICYEQRHNTLHVGHNYSLPLYPK
jgi:hypothetical protein